MYFIRPFNFGRELHFVSQNKNWNMFIKFYQYFCLKTAGSDYSFQCIFQVNMFFSIKYGDRKLKNKTWPTPPLTGKWSLL